MSPDDCPVIFEGLRCDLIRGHEGKHLERWVARWEGGRLPVEWYDIESGEYRPVMDEGTMRLIEQDAAEAAWVVWKDGCVTRPPKASFLAGWRAGQVFAATVLGSSVQEPEHAEEDTSGGVR